MVRWIQLVLVISLVVPGTRFKMTFIQKIQSLVNFLSVGIVCPQADVIVLYSAPPSADLPHRARRAVNVRSSEVALLVDVVLDNMFLLFMDSFL